MESFSVSLLEKEIEFEKQYSREVIEDLITLYSQAIEHYNEIQDPKYFDYQDRLHTFLLKPEVTSVLNGKKTQNMYNSFKRSTLCNQKYLRNKILGSSKVVGKQRIDTEKGKVNKEEIVRNVKSQEKELEARVDRRRSRKLINFNDVSTKPSYIYDEKEQMEEIMEKYFNDKAKNIEEITLRYMLEMESSTDANKSELIKKMNKEIIEISQFHDNLRIFELNSLKTSPRHS